MRLQKIKQITHIISILPNWCKRVLYMHRFDDNLRIIWYAHMSFHRCTSVKLLFYNIV